jgi:hypothetical protein
MIERRLIEKLRINSKLGVLYRDSDRDVYLKGRLDDLSNDSISLEKDDGKLFFVSLSRIISIKVLG